MSSIGESFSIHHGDFDEARESAIPFRLVFISLSKYEYAASIIENRRDTEYTEDSSNYVYLAEKLLSKTREEGERCGI